MSLIKLIVLFAGVLYFPLESEETEFVLLPEAACGQSDKRPAAQPPTGKAHRSPKPSKVDSGRPLHVESLTHAAKDGWLGAGSLVRVTLRGTASAEAVFDIPGLAHSVPLKEESPGLYAAQYKIPTAKPAVLEPAVLLARINEGDRHSAPAASRAALRIDSAPPVIEEVFPKPSSEVARQRVPILARVSDQNGSGLMPERARLLIDQEDMSDSLVAAPGTLTYLPGMELEPGDHTAHLMIYDRAGNMKSQSWTFTVMDTNGSIHAITTNAERINSPGDILTVTLEGMWGAKAGLLVGDSAEIPMKEQSPGYYEGTYTVKAADLNARVPLAVRFAVPDLKPFTETLEQCLRPPVEPAMTPAITHPPTAEWTAESPLIKGKAAPRSLVRLKLEYRVTIDGREVTGALCDQSVRVPASGTWEHKPSADSPILAALKPRFTLTATLLTPESPLQEDPLPGAALDT